MPTHAPLRRVTATFFKKNSTALLCAGLGAVCFLLVYGPAVLNPTADAWIFKGYIGVDLVQHYTGWVAFRAADWALPLTFTPGLNWPFGGPASLADCIPVAAVFFKLLSPLLPATFQYFGLFVLFCMAAMGFFAAKLLGLFVQSRVCQIVGSLVFILSPVLLERAFQHTALAAQFLVVASLYLYFRGTQTGFKAPPWGFVGLAGLAAATHVYFVPMVLGLAFASFVGALHAGASRPFRWLAASVATAVAVAGVLGFFAPSQYIPGGYGNFGVNLNTFWNPASYHWPTWDATYEHLRWSRFLPERPVVGDSIGSFSYLGLGVLLGLACAAVLGIIRAATRNPPRHALFSLAKKHSGLLISILCLSVFAVSNRVTANSRTLFEIPLPALVIRLADTFRASGRLIWPLYYLLMLAAVVGLCRGLPALFARTKKGHWLAVAGLCLLVTVQALDISPGLAQKHADFHPLPVPAAATPPENWAQVAQRGRVWYVLEATEDRTTALHAAKAGMPSNYYLLARGGQSAMQAHRQATRTALLAGEIPHANTAYATKDAALAAQLRQRLAGLCQEAQVAGYTVFLAG